MSYAGCLALAVIGCTMLQGSGSITDPAVSGGGEGGPPGGGGGDGGSDPGSGGVVGGGSGGSPPPADAGQPTDGVPRPNGPLPADPCVAANTCPPGVWINVTPSSMPAVDLRPSKDAFGPGSIVGDPARPSDMYVGGSKSGLWKSTDYGNRWTQINKTIPDVPRGVVIAVAGTTPATVWAAGYRSIHKSTDAGVTFKQTTLMVDLYSLKVDPYDPTHLISGLHEADGIYESSDGGITWRKAPGGGFPTGGVSWYPFFIDTGNSITTRGKWFAIAQGGGSATMTSDNGATWTVPAALRGLQHPHGVAQIFQHGNTLFVAGINGPGQGVYRSTDLGGTWARVDGGMAPLSVVWGTDKNVYATYSWACSNCNVGTNFQTSPQPGTSWSKANVPSALVMGANSLVVTNDGNHNIFVGLMWDQGMWRYVEP
ncbi:MAG TPA: hypothetical protein VN914_20785 [Polyangia bacterium]|nr:hypothetical protein [Polyangia bacterium]